MPFYCKKHNLDFGAEGCPICWEEHDAEVEEEGICYDCIWARFGHMDVKCSLNPEGTIFVKWVLNDEIRCSLFRSFVGVDNMGSDSDRTCLDDCRWFNGNKKYPACNQANICTNINYCTHIMASNTNCGFYEVDEALKMTKKKKDQKWLEDQLSDLYIYIFNEVKPEFFAKIGKKFRDKVYLILNKCCQTYSRDAFMKTYIARNIEMTQKLIKNQLQYMSYVVVFTKCTVFFESFINYFITAHKKIDPRQLAGIIYVAVFTVFADIVGTDYIRTYANKYIRTILKWAIPYRLKRKWSVRFKIGEGDYNSEYFD